MDLFIFFFFFFLFFLGGGILYSEGRLGLFTILAGMGEGVYPGDYMCY